jgi:phage terminase large subunit-like protein
LGSEQVMRSLESWDEKAMETWEELKDGPGQTPPEGDWSTWLFLGGRGAGKTFAGARWLQRQAAPGARLALVGPSLHDVREVMIEGPSGVIALAPPGARPVYHASRRRLEWPNGAVAHALSAEDPESFRGPQFDAAWADEFCAWRKAGEVIALLRMGLRRGARPRLAVTTTPKPLGSLRRLMGEASTAVTRATTADNAPNLSPGFREGLEALYGGTRLAAQELDGLVVEDDGAALWRAADLAACRAPPPAQGFDRVVVAVDPPASAHGDACGIVAAGRRGERAWVLADASLEGGSPLAWATRAAETARRLNADALVAEANQGGEMVRGMLAVAGADRPIRLVHASRSKRARAEPVAALYEQGRVSHVQAFPRLEEEMLALGSSDGPSRSPDRADALVWAISELMLGGPRPDPRLRVL